MSIQNHCNIRQHTVTKSTHQQHTRLDQVVVFYPFSVVRWEGSFADPNVQLPNCLCVYVVVCMNLCFVWCVQVCLNQLHTQLTQSNLYTVHFWSCRIWHLQITIITLNMQMATHFDTNILAFAWPSNDTTTTHIHKTLQQYTNIQQLWLFWSNINKVKYVLCSPIDVDFIDKVFSSQIRYHCRH